MGSLTWMVMFLVVVAVMFWVVVLVVMFLVVVVVVMFLVVVVMSHSTTDRYNMWALVPLLRGCCWLWLWECCQIWCIGSWYWTWERWFPCYEGELRGHCMVLTSERWCPCYEGEQWQEQYWSPLWRQGVSILRTFESPYLKTWAWAGLKKEIKERNTDLQ